MNCPRIILPLLCTLALTAPPSVPEGQKPAAPAQQEDVPARIKVSTNLVIVPVTVKDSEGRLVVDLRKEEFRILEDDIEQNVDVFSNDPFPLSLVVLVDSDLKKDMAQQVESSLPAIVGGLSEKDEAFVCRFDLNLHEGKGFTRDSDKLMTELKRLRLDSEPAGMGPGGAFSGGPTLNGQPAPGSPQEQPSAKILKGRRSKALDDAMYEAAELLHGRGRDRRKMILLISDGENVKKYKYSFDDAVKKLQESDISVFSVGVGSAFLNRKFTPLSKYAHATGGDVYYVVKRDSIEELYSRVTEEARNQYTLAYTSRGTDRTIDYHSIEVRVKRPGLTILTRYGYYIGAPTP